MIRSLTLSLFLLASTASAQSLVHVRVETPDASSLGESLLNEGYDVLEGSITSSKFELVLSDPEFEALTRRGLDLQLIARGRPFNDIQAEQEIPVGYSDLQGILDAMALTAANFPDIAELVDLTARYGMPTTAEGRNIFAMKISDNVTLDEDEPSSLLVSAHHCREIVNPVIAMHGIDQLTSLYGIDPTVTSAVDENEIWIVPVWNVDGYNEVFVGNNLWRKNRRVLPGGIGVDLNRNYPFGWDTPCSGSTVVSSQTYKGPSAASEVETLTMIAFGNDRRFSRVVDLHSSGREVLYGFLCNSSPLTTYWLDRAVGLATGAGYAGSTRPPTAEGENYQWHIAQGALSFLIETHTTFQPTFASAEAEANLVWPGIFSLFTSPIPLTGHVQDACTGDPLVAALTVDAFPFQAGEVVESGGPFGRYDYFLPRGNTTIRFDASGFDTAAVATGIPPVGTTTEEFALAADVQFSTTGTLQIGTTTQFNFDSLSDANQFYVTLISISGTSPGTPLNNCTLPINIDSTSLYAIDLKPVFKKFIGVLDGSGMATGNFIIPNDPTLVGAAVDFAYFTADTTTGLAIHASDALSVQIQP